MFVKIYIIFGTSQNCMKNFEINIVIRNLDSGTGTILTKDYIKFCIFIDKRPFLNKCLFYGLLQ